MGCVEAVVPYAVSHAPRSDSMHKDRGLRRRRLFCVLDGLTDCRFNLVMRWGVS